MQAVEMEQCGWEVQIELISLGFAKLQPSAFQSQLLVFPLKNNNDRPWLVWLSGSSAGL